MRYFAATLLLAGTIIFSSTAHADYEDKIWVAQCIRDNSQAEAKTEVLYKYCKCMTDKMDDAETMTVTEWESTHTSEKSSCRFSARWNAPSPPPVPAPAPDAPHANGWRNPPTDGGGR